MFNFGLFWEFRDPDNEEYEDPQPQEPKESSEIKKFTTNSQNRSSRGIVVSDEHNLASYEGVIAIENSIASDYLKQYGKQYPPC